MGVQYGACSCQILGSPLSTDTRLSVFAFLHGITGAVCFWQGFVGPSWDLLSQPALDTSSSGMLQNTVPNKFIGISFWTPGLIALSHSHNEDIHKLGQMSSTQRSPIQHFFSRYRTWVIEAKNTQTIGLQNYHDQLNACLGWSFWGQGCRNEHKKKLFSARQRTKNVLLIGAKFFLEPVHHQYCILVQRWREIRPNNAWFYLEKENDELQKLQRQRLESLTWKFNDLMQSSPVISSVAAKPRISLLFDLSSEGSLY